MGILRILAVGCVAVMALASAHAEQKIFTNSDGVAVNGYDVVAYFDSEATRGIPGFEVEYQRATWYFETQANADKFQRDPEKYAPQFGGFCAYGVSQGYLVATDPYAWSIVKGKLYLNYNATIRTRWLSDLDQYLTIAQKHWARLGRLAKN